MACIYVVLLRTRSVIGRVVLRINRDEVNHAAISLDKDLHTLCGFGRASEWMPLIAGFRHETYRSGYYGKLPQLDGRIMRVEVTDEQFQRVANIIDEFWDTKDDYHYGFVKLFSNLLGVEVHDPHRFICSEFVAYVLQQAGVVSIAEPLNLVRPQVLLDSLRQIGAQTYFHGDMKEYVWQADLERLRSNASDPEREVALAGANY